MHVTGLYIIDSILTIGFSLFILWGVFRNLQEVINLFLEGVPANVNIQLLKDELCAIEGVESIHDVHVWSLDGASNLFTGHVVLNAAPDMSRSELYREMKALLKKYHITHTTIEFEGVDGAECFGNRCD